MDDARNKLEIGDWRDSPPPNGVNTPSSRHFLPPTIIGLIGTLLLHALLIQSVQLGAWGQKGRLPPLQRNQQSNQAESDEENLTLISMISTRSSRDTLANVVSSTFVPSKIQLEPSIVPDAPPLSNVDSLTLGDEQAPDSAINGGERARLTGIYTGQIEARIDRIWHRPRTPVSELEEDRRGNSSGESFQCEAQIVQNADGYVQEILLPRCNGSPAWQRSLVRAIRQASPLPAPPDPSVFARSITLRFVGLPFVPGGSSEGYELVSVASTK
jgi:hypothetical protein